MVSAGERIFHAMAKAPTFRMSHLFAISFVCMWCSIMMVIFHNAKRELVQRISALERANKLGHKVEAKKGNRLNLLQKNCLFSHMICDISSGW